MATALAAFSAHAAKDTCPQELHDAYQEFLTNLRAHNFNSGAASGTGKASEDLKVWLKQANDEVVRHENAHKTAAGRWGGTIQYMYYRWWDIPYAVAGCHIPKRGIPLKIALKSLLAPEQPSKWDLRNAEEIKKLIKQKASR
jgi:hypothetical protein